MSWFKVGVQYRVIRVLCQLKLRLCCRLGQQSISSLRQCGSKLPLAILKYLFIFAYLFVPVFFRLIGEIQAAEVNCGDVNRVKLSVSENAAARILACRHNCSFSPKFITLSSNVSKQGFWIQRERARIFRYMWWFSLYTYQLVYKDLLLLMLTGVHHSFSAWQILLHLKVLRFHEEQSPPCCRKPCRCAPCFSSLRPF